MIVTIESAQAADCFNSLAESLPESLTMAKIYQLLETDKYLEICWQYEPTFAEEKLLSLTWKKFSDKYIVHKRANFLSPLDWISRASR